MAQPTHRGGPFLCPDPLRRFSISACATSAMLPDGRMLLEDASHDFAWRATAHRPQRRGRCCCDCCSANCLRNPAASSVADASPPCRSPRPPARGVPLADVAG